VKRVLPLSLSILALAAIVVGCKKSEQTVTLAIPCGLTVPLREAMAKFESANPGVKMEGTFDNAITNALNIKEKGNRPSLFISPGKREMEILEEQGLIDETTKAAFGLFRLVVVTPKDNPKDIHSLAELKKADVISLPDPERNSIGVYGKQALEKAGLWDALMPKGDEKILLTEFPITAYEMIATGKADAALMFENCPMKTYPEKLQKGSVVIVGEVDKSLYEEPLCYVACLKEGPNLETARKFIAFLADPATQKLLSENGLDPLNERAQEMLPEAIKNPVVAAANATSGEPKSTASAPPVSAQTRPLKPEELKLPIKVEAYYPGNPDHAYLRELVEGLPKRYPGKVEVEFIDFNSEEGYTRWHDQRGMSCGGILLNDAETFLVNRKGKTVEVTFMMGEESGEWTRADLYYVLDKATGKQ